MNCNGQTRAKRGAPSGWSCLLAALLWAGTGLAQETPDSRAFKAAARDFQIGVFDRAEREFAQFVAAFPDSQMLPEAILLQARAAIEQTNLAVAIRLLDANIGKAGPLAEQYLYRKAEAHFLSRNYAASASAFAALTRDFTNSTLRLEAGYGEALARSRLRDFPKVVVLLEQTNGVFQTAAQTRPTDKLTVRGHLLLGEALFEQKAFRDAEAVVQRLPEKDWTPEFKWDRQHLLCRILAADRRPAEALEATTNLVTLALATARPNLVADSLETQGNLLQQLGLLEAALGAYTNNLAETTPVEQRRLALLHQIEIKLAQDKVVEAAQMIEAFLAKHPENAASDVALLTIGELQLKLHREAGATNISAGATAPATNHLAAALAQFEKFLTTQTNSPLLGKAYLDKGWCLWLDGKTPESAAAFKAAAQLLPWSEDLAQARFKLGDAQFAQGDFTNALASYRAVTNDFASLPRVRANLIDHALFQMVRANLEVKNLVAASAVADDLWTWSPASSFGDLSHLLVGQGFLDADDAVQARERFAALLLRWPESSLRPETELAVARSYFQASAWSAAITHHRDWVARFPSNSLRPQAEFDLALAHWHSGSESNAFSLCTNFLAVFPAHELAPRAQYWLGDYYVRQGDWVNAQGCFQRIVESTNWPVTRLTYQARLAAGQAAFARQDWKGAADERGHFTLLVNDNEAQSRYPDIVAEAIFALGDTFTRWLKPPENFDQARKAFMKIPQLYATNSAVSALVPLAWGRIGDCSLQLAGQDAKQYAIATNAYRSAMSNAAADIITRSRAEFGLAAALEAQAGGASSPENAALRKAAFDHFYNIAFGANLGSGEDSDPSWVKDAGFAAARLAEEQRQWTVARNIYQRMQDLLAPLRPRLQEKIDKVQEQLQREKN